jgi:hypothetical protein
MLESKKDRGSGPEWVSGPYQTFDPPGQTFDIRAWNVRPSGQTFDARTESPFGLLEA